MGIMQHFPQKLSPRLEQLKLLEAVASNWTTTDVFVLEAPVALGKSAIAYTIAKWRASFGETVAITTPSNILLNQYAESFPDLDVLKRQSLYNCVDFKRSCAATKESIGFFCKGCPCAAAKKKVEEARVRVATAHGYCYNQLHSQTVVHDEAHSLVDLLRDTFSVKIWRKKDKFPDHMQTLADVIEWAQGALRTKPNKRLQQTLDELLRIRLGAVIEYKQELNRGKLDTVLHVNAISAVSAGPFLWPNKVRKIVLMSATIGPKDIEELRLHKRRVTYLKCDSPIPAANRPIIYAPAANMAYQYRKASVPMLAAKLRELLATYPTKGLVHLPYDVAAQLQAHLDDPRLIWHNKANKTAQFNAFKASDPVEGKVLVASGMYEGVDLPYDAARWQVIGVVPYPPLSVEWIKTRAAEDPGWYAWQTCKSLIQASGRVVRAADDQGDTVVTDMQFGRLLSRHRDLFPSYFLEAIRS
jgi:Rad3-related DNA helicase